MKRKLTAFLLCLALALLSGCGEGAPAAADTGGEDTQPSAQATAFQTSLSELDLEFTARDLDVGYEETTAAQASLLGDSIQVSGTGAQAEGSTLKITEDGEYVLSGTLTDGQILVEAGDQDKVHLILAGVEIHCETGPAILIRSADKVFLTLKGGTENMISDGENYVLTEEENNLDGVIFSRADLTLNGEGTLHVEASYRHGIVSKDDLVLTGGSYEITAPGQGLSGKDCVKVSGGSFVLTTGGDGIQSDNGEDQNRGYVYLQGGDFTIDAATDAIQAETVLKLDGGTYALTAGGGSGNASTDSGGERMPGWGQWGQEAAAETQETPSAKGLKAGETLLVTGGVLSIDSSDDAVHCNGDVAVTGGELTLRSGDDGIHADNALVVEGGILRILQSYEGLEGLSVTVSGGDLEVTARDDGLNAAGGSDGSSLGGRPGQNSFAVDGDALIRITGGVLTVDAQGDGLDSNGMLYVEGGTVTVYGPENDGNGALDYNGTATVSGGTVVAVGSAGMAQGFSGESAQCSVLINLESQAEAGTELTLSDGTGAVVLRCAPAKRYQSVLFSSPELEQGKTYTLTAGDQSVEAALTGTATTVGQTGGMMGGGMMGGGPGGRPQR